MSRIWLTREPKSIGGLELLSITQQLQRIETEVEKQYWLRALYDWDIRSSALIKETSIYPKTGKKWYTHRMIRRVRHLLVSALPDMFHHLEDDKIPKNTNAYEFFLAI
jgi:hypothetical protein